MQPELPTPVNPERQPAAPERRAEQLNVPVSPEIQTGARMEQAEKLSETAARAAETTNQPATVLPTVVPVAAPAPVTDTPTSDTPVVAADEDLIEKEWVDKAKAIIAATREDPSARERGIAQLQADYLKKRYGKELGADL